MKKPRKYRLRSVPCVPATDARAQGQAFYRAPAWKALRKAVIARDHGLCRRCGGDAKGFKKGHVDHIKSRKQRPDLALSMGNLILLCASCHSEKTATVDGGFGNDPDRMRRIGCDANGLPLDPTHPWHDRES